MPQARNKPGLERAGVEVYELFKLAPAWVGPALALGGYLVFHFLVPVFVGDSAEPRGNMFAHFSKIFARWLAVGILVIWVCAEFQKFRNRRLLDSRADVASLRDLRWQEFERLVGEAFRRQGYAVQETPAGADGGVDLVLNRDSERTLVQCKQWKSRKVGVKVIRELFGIVAGEHAARGIVVCCGYYTKEARSFAENKPLKLIDGSTLWRMIEDVNQAERKTGGMSGRTDPVPSAQDSIPSCPKCGSAMVLRTARKGAHEGSQFYGCSKFPACRGIREHDD